MMNAEEKEYMDYLIHNRTELTNQITKHSKEMCKECYVKKYGNNK